MDLNENLILETFLRLTNRTYPYGTEDYLVKSMIEQGIFPEDIQKDKHDNYYYKIGESRTIFASHLDTVSKDFTNVVHTFDGKIIGTDGKTTLGADDKAGVTILLHLIKNKIPGLYYFFIGEEVGCIGSGLASSESILDFKGKYDRIVSFDRRGTSSVITHQSSIRCCSDDFANSLVDALNMNGMSYEKDDSGVYTDSAEFIDIIPECTNISVGYYKEHTTSETQDIEHLISLADACLFVDWENLPTKRDMSKKEYKSFNNWSGSYNTSINHWDDSYDDDLDWRVEYSNYKKTRRGDKRKSREFLDGGNGELIPYKNSSKLVKEIRKENYYESLIDKIVKDDISKKDLEIIKEQYLDMNDESDIAFYHYLIGNIID